MLPPELLLGPLKLGLELLLLGALNPGELFCDLLGTVLLL